MMSRLSKVRLSIPYKMASLFALLLCSLLVTTIAAEKYTNYTEFDGGNYKLWWRHENSTDTFYFKVEVGATGWIGFGITLLDSEPWMRGAMMKYDVVVAGVYNDGKHYSEDYLTAYLNNSQIPHIDEKNNWEITSAKEDAGKTTLEFNRKRKTDDPMNIHRPPYKGDIEITPGRRNFVWAYHENIDTPYLNDTSLKHTKSGIKPVTLIKEDVKEPVYKSYPSKNNRSSQASTITVISTFTFVVGSLLTFVTVCFF